MFLDVPRSIRRAVDAGPGHVWIVLALCLAWLTQVVPVAGCGGHVGVSLDAQALDARNGWDGGLDGRADGAVDGRVDGKLDGSMDGGVAAVTDAAMELDGGPPPAPGCRNVAIGGGGYVTGVYAHPSVPDLVYIRTDVGGPYRWDPAGTRWIPLADEFPWNEKQAQQVLGLALDSSDPDVVYIAAGFGDGGKIYKSTDQGESWTALHTLYVNGNARYRWTGERLVVDPFNSSVILYGSQQGGLLRGTGGGANWSRVTSVPPGDAPAGVNSVAFDPSTPGRVYVASRGRGVYVSTDHGASFARIAGSPNDVNRMQVAQDGTLFVTRSGGVSKYAGGSWTNLSLSAPNGFNSLAVDPRDPSHVLVAEHGQWVTKIYRSTDAGRTWRRITVQKVSTVAWWPDAFFANWSSSLLFDPVRPGRVWQTDWFGIWRTEDITAATTVWTAYERGHEEVVTHDLLSLPSGYELISAVADVGGFVHAALDQFPTERMGKSDGTSVKDNYSLASDPTNPLRVLRVGGSRDDTASWGYLSDDGGNTWRPMQGAPAGKIARRIVHSGGGGRSLMIFDDRGQPYYNADGTGNSWRHLGGLPQQESFGPWVKSERAAADGAQPDTFYYVLGRTLYVSTGGSDFVPVRSDLPDTSAGSKWSYVSLVPTPGVARDLWLGLERGGLFHLVAPDMTPTPVGGFSTAFWVTLGVPASGSTDPTVFVTGIRNGQAGLYWSIDSGATFMDGTDPKHRVILRGKLEASRQTFGRVFLGYGGRGIFVCDLSP